jgi:hypothetical protein
MAGREAFRTGRRRRFAPVAGRFVAACLLASLAACGGGGGEADTAGVSPAPTADAPLPPPPPPAPQTPNGLGDGTNLRTEASSYVATFRDPDATTYDARQLKGSFGWLVESPATLDGLIVYGQSNAGLNVATDTNLNLRKPLFPHTVVGSSLYFAATDQTLWPNVAAPPFVDLYDPPDQSAHLPATLDAYAAEQVSRDGGRAPSGIYAYTQWQGGAPIEAFVKGSVNYRDLLAEVRRTTASAKLYGRSFAVRGIVWIQGETVSPNYGATLERLADDLAADIQAVTGQTSRPELMIQQINRLDPDPRITDVELDQLALARRRFGTGITMIGPMYQARLGAGDFIHVADTGKMALADVAGLAIDRIRRGQSFTPLWPIAVTRNGAEIDVKFAVPGKALAFDTDLVPPTTAQGFAYRDDANSAHIVAVALVGGDIVRITLDQAPSGTGRRIDYALGYEPANGFVAARGNLYSEDAATSVYSRLGYPVPTKVRHYAVRFSEVVP